MLGGVAHEAQLGGSARWGRVEPACKEGESACAGDFREERGREQDDAQSVGNREGRGVLSDEKIERGSSYRFDY